MPSQLEIAAHLDLSVRRVRDLLPEIHCKSSDGLDVIRVAYIRRLRETAAARQPKSGDLDLVAERARLTMEQADKTALENGRLRGELVSAADVRTQLERVFGAIRSRILAIPTKFAPQVLGLQTLAEIRASLDKGAREALTELATFELDDADTTVHTGGAAGIPGATVTDSERVGGPVPKAKSRGKRRAGSMAD